VQALFSSVSQEIKLLFSVLYQKTMAVAISGQETTPQKFQPITGVSEGSNGLVLMAREKR
jgi:hypothetical protein